MPKVDVYSVVTAKIVELLESGVNPWIKTWSDAGGGLVARSGNTGKAYRGINSMLLDPGHYLTFNQVKKLKGKVKKGSKSSLVVFWKFIDKKTETGESERYPLLRHYNVFELSQTENVELPKLVQNQIDNASKPQPDFDSIEAAENVIKGYANQPGLHHDGGDRAYYRPDNDSVHMPLKAAFDNNVDYYTTLFHEFGHSTGHETRLKRSGITNINFFGSHEYSKEELVAEMIAAFLSGKCGFVDSMINNSAAYLRSWIKKLKQDNKLIVSAAGQAQKGADYILGVTFNA